MAARLLLLAFLCLPITAFAQDRPDDPVGQVERFQAYLARKPFHEGGLDRMVAAAVSVNGLAELVAGYERLVAEGTGGLADRVVLARLYARADRVEEALELLAAVEDQSAELARLRGALLLRESRVDEAVAALEAAAGLADDPRLLEEIHAARGAAFLAAGDPAKAHRAFLDLADLDPTDFNLRIETAEVLAENGLVAEAIEQYRKAAELAADDVPRLCRALSHEGQLAERTGALGDALAVYERAVELMGRGNWLKRDLRGRILSIHRRSGTLDELATTTGQAAENDPQDLDQREFLADVLVEMRDFEGARDVLLAAVGDFPADLALGRRLVDVFDRLGDVDGKIAEYQRILEYHPEELELYLELGQVFASDGRLEQARLQWERTLETRLQDAGLCARLSGFYALFEMYDEAAAMLERALALEPNELEYLSDLASLRVRQGVPDALPGILDRAEEIAGDDAGRLENLAALARGFRDNDRARRALESALASKPDDVRLLRTLADLLVETRELDAATDVLQRIVDGVRDTTARKDAADRLVRIYQRDYRLADLRAKEEALLAADPANVGARFILAEVALQRGREREAIEHLTELLEARPEDEAAHLALARVYEEEAEDEKAIAQYRRLIELRPTSRGQHLKSIARIHIENRQKDDARECYEEVLELSPDNPAAFVEVADAYRDMRDLERAAECLEQAVRLRPDDGNYRMKLAELYEDQDDLDRAEKEVLVAAGSEDEHTRDRARGWLYDRMIDDGRIEDEIASLRDRIDANPYDVELPLTLTDIFVRELEYELALDLIGDLLAYRPKDPRLLRERARLSRLMERWEDAATDYEELWRLPGSDREQLVFELAECALQLGDKPKADKLLVQSTDLLRIANLYDRNELRDDAVGVLERALLRTPDDRMLLARLARFEEQAGNFERALAVHRRIVDLDGETWDHLRRLGELHLAHGDRDGAIECGRRMLRTLVRPTEPEIEDRRRARRAFRRARTAYTKRLSELQAFFDGNGLSRDFDGMAREAILAEPTDSTLLGVALGRMQRRSEGGQAALELLVAVRGATLDQGVVPAGYDERSWTRYLDGREKNLYRTDPTLAEQRSEQIEGTADVGEVTEEKLDELIDLYRTQDKPADLMRAYELGVERFPDNVEYRAGLAAQQMGARRYTDAEPMLRELLAQLDGSARYSRTKDPLKVPRSHARRFKKKLTEELSALADDERVAIDYRLGLRCPFTVDWNPGRSPKIEDVRVQLGHCLVRLGKEDEARAILAPLEPGHPEVVHTAAVLAGIYESHGWAADAERLYASVLDVTRRVGADAVLRHGRSWRSEVADAVAKRAHAMASEGRGAEAYELIRRWRGPDEALAMFQLSDDGDGIAAHLESRYGEELARPSETGLEEPLRSAAILHVEVLQARLDWASAAGVYRALLEREPDDFDLRKALARVEEKAGRWEQALDLHDASIARKRELFEETGESTAGPSEVVFFSESPPATPYDLHPYLPETRGEAADIARQMEQAFSWYVSQNEGAYIWDDLSAVFRIAYENDDLERASKALDEMVDVNPQVVSWVQWELSNSLEKRKLGAAALPLWRAVYESDPDQDNIVRSYGSALVEAGELAEAKRIYNKFLRRPVGDVDEIARIERALHEIEPAEEAALPRATSELESAVATDPKNAKLRVALVRRLLDERRYEDACEHALEAERIAPHLEEVRELAMNALVLTGRDEEYEARLVEAIRRLTSVKQQLVAAGQVAAMRLERGDEEGARQAFVEATKRGQHLNDYLSPAGWYARRGHLAEARAILEGELNAVNLNRSWLAERVHEAIAEIAILEGDPIAAMDAQWRSEGHEQQSLDPGFVEDLAEYLLGVEDLAAIAPAVRAAAEGRGGLQEVAYLAALALAGGDRRAAEERLVELAVETSAARELLPYAVGLAREREDWAAALAYLDTIEEHYPTSERRKVQTSLGELSERQSLFAERGSLQLALGDEAAARATWEEAFAHAPDRELTLAKLYAEQGVFEDAAHWIAERRRGAASPVVDELMLGVAIDRRLGRHEEVVRGLEVVLRVDPNARGAGVRSALAEAYRALGQLDDLRAMLERDLADDSGDGWAAATLVNLTFELDGLAGVEALIEGEFADDSVVTAVLTELAERAREVGDLERAAGYLRRVVDVEEYEWNRRQRANALARVLELDGRFEEAAEAVRQAFDDPDGATAWEEAGKRLVGAKQHGLAERFFAKALEIDPGSGGARRSRMNALKEIGRKVEALELALEPADDPDATYADFGSAIADLARETGEDVRIETALQANPDDVALLSRAALIRFHGDDHARAAEALERLLAIEPDQRLAKSLLWRAYRSDGRYVEAIAALEHWIELLDREHVLRDDGDRGRNSELDVLRTARGVLYLRTSGADAAVAAWKDELGRRFSAIDSSDFSLWNIANRSSSQIAFTLWTYGLYEHVLEAAREEGFSRYSIEARFRSGDRGGALAALWDECFDRNPKRRRSRGGRMNFDYAFGILLRLHRENGTLEALGRRVVAERAAVPDSVNRAEACRRVWVALEQHDELIADRERTVAENTADRDALRNLALAYRAAGRYEDGYATLARSRDDLPSPFVQVSDDGGSLPYSFDGAGVVGNVRFAFGNEPDAAFGVMSSVSFGSFTSTRSSAASVVPSGVDDDLWIALSFETDRREDALVGEREALRRLERDGDATPLLTLARRYAQLDLADESERLQIAHVEAHPDDAVRAYRELADLFARVGRADESAAYVRRWFESYSVDGEKETPARLWARVRRRAHWNTDLDAARREMARALELDPDGEHTPSDGEMGWIRLAFDQPEEALSHFRAQAESDRFAGRLHRFDDSRYGLGFALARTEGLDAARPVLMRALAEVPTSRHATSARELLEE